MRPLILFVSIHNVREPLSNLESNRRFEYSSIIELSNLDVLVLVTNQSYRSNEELSISVSRSLVATLQFLALTAVPVTKASSNLPSSQASTSSFISKARSETSISWCNLSLASSSTLFRVTPSRIMSPRGGVTSSGLFVCLFRITTKKLLAPASVTSSFGPKSHSV